MSSDLADGVGALVDIKLGDTILEKNVEVNVAHGSGSVVCEYTVDLEPGAHTLDLDFTNDSEGLAGDRNLKIDMIELANDGSTYTVFQPTKIGATPYVAEDGTVDNDWLLHQFAEYDRSKVTHRGAFEAADGSASKASIEWPLSVWQGGSNPFILNFS